MLRRWPWCRVRSRAWCEGIQGKQCSHDASAVGAWVLGVGRESRAFLVKGARVATKSSELELCIEIELKSLILAQIERWRHALHMQVERGEGATSHSVANG